MISDELFDLFRADIGDVALPHLWSDSEVWLYLNDAYWQFVRLTGGIADFTSAATQAPIITGNANGVLHPSILRIMSAYRVSDGAEIKVINSTDFPLLRANDYNTVRPQWLDTTPGPVRYMMIGAQRDIARWVQVPAADDVAQLTVYRLPLTKITSSGQEFTGVSEEHHFHLLKWMRHLAYQKQDADTFDRGKRDENELAFRLYCAQVTAEIERYKAKPRSIAYGGI